MQPMQVEEVLACLPRDKTRFHYHRDRYVLYLLERLHRRGELRTVRDVKRSRYARWLERPLLKPWLAEAGRDDLPLDELALRWPVQEAAGLSYVLTADRWGQALWDPWYQTSRPGQNVVLQLNLPSSHARVFEACGVEQVWRLRRHLHPLSEARMTLAWARLDWDWESGQAMIEEIQSDWLRDFPLMLAQARTVQGWGEEMLYWHGRYVPVRAVLDYAPKLEAHRVLWSEAMLTAALQFLLEEMGLREVFYHSWRTGNAVKRLEGDACPPQSLYRELPERFCFERVARGPEFLEHDPKVKKVKRRLSEGSDWRWYRWAA